MQGPFDCHQIPFDVNLSNFDVQSNMHGVVCFLKAGFRNISLNNVSRV